MANELTINGSVAFSKGNVATKTLAVQTLRANVSGADFIQATQSIPTTAGGTAISIPAAIGTPGWFFIKNNDATNYVTILDSVSGAALLKLKAGEVAMGRFASAAPAALANTAAVVIEYLIVED